MSQGCPYSIAHIHGTMLQYLPHLVNIEMLTAITITRDRNGASVNEMLPALRLIQEHKPLIIQGMLDKEDIDIVLQELSYRGLYLSLIIESVEEAEFWWEYILRQCQGGKDEFYS